MKTEALDPIVVRHGLAILDGDKDAILLLADRLQELRHPHANRVRELYHNSYFSAPRDESLAVLLALPEKWGWVLACDFAEHYLKENHAASFTEDNKNFQIVQACRGWIAGDISKEHLAELLHDAPRYYQSWGKASNGIEAACNALAGILAFSATGGREPAWQHRRIREYLLGVGVPAQ